MQDTPEFNFPKCVEVPFISPQKLSTKDEK